MLALRLRFSQRAAHIVCVGDCLAADIEDNVAALEPLISGGPIGIHLNPRRLPAFAKQALHRGFYG
jgi:hypothetical protein